ncbi:MAG TPA: homoserine dehydrogenase [Chloroflexota bacterium]|nr:homoserine dehydrogenase [Chloroflexota bacterium]
MEKPFRIGLLGLGVVGTAVAHALVQKRGVLERRIGCPIELRRALVRDPDRSRPIDPSLITLNADDILDDPAIDVVVEVMGGEDPAHAYILRALRAGKHVVTANKEVMAKHGPEILTLAAEHGVDISFEASVGGGIPVIGPFKLDLIANEIREIRAIINGTTNFILTRMAADGIEFADALAEAQQLGYAEADPRNDVDGIDAAYKLAILGSLAFHTVVRPSNVYYEGIASLSATDFRYARELGYAIKLLAIARAERGAVELRVHPTLLPETEMLAKIDGVFNAVAVEGDLVGRILFYGRGAGAGPTSSAVVADIIDVAQRSLAGLGGSSRRTAPTYDEQVRFRPMDEVCTRYYLRLLAHDRPGVFAQITHALGEAGISLASVIQKQNVELGEPRVQYAEIVLMTHEAKEAAMQRALRSVRALAVVRDIGSMIRVEG